MSSFVDWRAVCVLLDGAETRCAVLRGPRHEKQEKTYSKLLTIQLAWTQLTWTLVRAPTAIQGADRIRGVDVT